MPWDFLAEFVAKCLYPSVRVFCGMVCCVYKDECAADVEEDCVWTTSCRWGRKKDCERVEDRQIDNQLCERKGGGGMGSTTVLRTRCARSESERDKRTLARQFLP